MEVYQNVHVLRSKGCNVYVVLADKTYLIDTGTPGNVNLLLPQLSQLNAKLDGIIITHAHFDHVGSAYDLQKMLGCPVYIHREDYPYLVGEKKYNYKGVLGKVAGLIEKLNKIKVPDKIKDVENLNGKISIVHTPGHTPGSISILYDKCLICGDLVRHGKKYLLFGKNEVQLSPKVFCSDYDEYIMSVKKVLELDFDVVLPGHGLPIDNAKEKLMKLVSKV